MRQLPTYTSVFRLQRRLYAVYDWELPVPLGLIEVAVFAVAAAVFFAAGQLLRIPVTASTAWFFVVPPAFLAYLARQPVADAKQPHAWIITQARYLLEPRVLVGLAEPRRRDARAARRELQQ